MNGEGKSPLQEFYRGTSVFVTGGTGFMGKVLVEKLLRSCPDIARIYLLLRPKRGMAVEDRIGDLLTSPCFENVLRESPNLRSKLVAIAGDIGLAGLGVSEADKRLLKEHVEVVFHVAATVRFNEPLKDAILQNVRGTRDVLALCRTFDKLKFQEVAMNGEGKSPLQEFYRGTSVFVTGGTGFMGKVLVEKLLRSCPDIARIYLLLRPKRGMAVEDRIGDLLTSPCFEKVLRERPNLRSKLVAIGGDIGLAGLGVSEADKRLLKEHVEVVFHVAATVRFNEPLKDAILQNVRGTRDVLALCRTFDKLKSVIHVSTAYSNCPRASIDEVLYDSPLHSDQAIKMAEDSVGDSLNQQSECLIQKWPNTYTFSKAISEHAVQLNGQGLPVGIVRPSVVLSCASEPMPGWVDGAYGPMGFTIAMGTGVAKTLYVSAENESNFVPCDLVNNCIIAAAWDVCNRAQPDIHVYNCVTPNESKHMSWRACYNHLIQDTEERPPTKSLWYISCFFTTSRVLTVILRILLHWLPALVLDTLSYAKSGNTGLVKMYKKLHTFSDAVFYFTSHEWKFDVDHVDQMRDRLSQTDQETFPFDFRTLHLDSYYRTYWAGIRKFLLKDSDETIPKAKARRHKLYIIHCCIKCAFVGMLSWLAWSAFQRSSLIGLIG